VSVLIFIIYYSLVVDIRLSFFGVFGCILEWSARLGGPLACGVRYSNSIHTLVSIIFLYYVRAICILKHAGTFKLKVSFALSSLRLICREPSFIAK